MATVYDNASLVYGIDTNIRLIELLSGPARHHGEDSKINCRFHVLSLASKPKYTAISYMWGQDTKTADIILDGKAFAVRINLFELLINLTKKKQDLIWIDAICIDQESIHERNHQVGLMGTIYSQAKAVIVWLGCDDERIGEAVDTLASYPQDSEMVKADIRPNRPWDNLLPEQSHDHLLVGPLERQDMQPEATVMISYTSPLSYDNTSILLPPHNNLTLLSSTKWTKGRTEKVIIFALSQLLLLCLHPYWSRAWIVQEVILPEDIKIQFRDKRVDMTRLAAQFQHIRSTLKDWERSHRGILRKATAILNSPAAKLLAKRDKWKDSRGRSYINPWDTGFGTLGCSDVRDRIYAMAALMDPKLVIAPDYNRTPSEIFRAIFEQHHKRTGSLTGTIWNLQSMLEIDDDDPTVQRSKEFGSLEWNPFYHHDK